MAREHFKEQIIPELGRQILVNPTPLYNAECKIGNQSAVSFSSMTRTGTHDLGLEQKNRLLIQSQQLQIGALKTKVYYTKLETNIFDNNH